MRIAITGASGFIGSHLASTLAAAGTPARLLVNQTAVTVPGEAMAGSLFDPSSLARFLEGVDVLFHLASALGGRRLDESGYFLVNREGAINLIRVAVAVGVRKVVHFSSAGVYGKTDGITPLRESDATHPVDAYERSKLAGEEAALSFSNQIDVTVVRPGWVYGERDRRTCKLISQIARGPFFIAGSGRPCQSVVHVSDLVRAVRLAADRGHRGGIYNLGGENIPVSRLVGQIAIALGRSPRFLHLPLAGVETAAWICERILGARAPLNRSKLAFFKRGKPLDSSRAAAELGFRPEIEFSAGIIRTVAWYRQAGWL